MTLLEFTKEKYNLSIKEKCEEVWITAHTAWSRWNKNRDEEDIYWPSLWHWWVRRYKDQFRVNYEWEKCGYQGYRRKLKKWIDKHLAIKLCKRWKTMSKNQNEMK